MVVNIIKTIELKNKILKNTTLRKMFFLADETIFLKFLDFYKINFFILMKK